MNEDNKILLESEITTQIEGLSNLEQGSKEHTAAVENVVKLYRLKIEEDKNVWEINEKIDRRLMENEQHNLDGQLKEKQIEYDQTIHELEQELKTAQLEEAKKDRYFKYGVEAGLGLLTLAFYGLWLRRGFKFEEEGTYRSKTFMNLTKFFKPKR